MKREYIQKYDGDESEYVFEDFISEKNGKKKNIKAVEIFTACCDCYLTHRRVIFIENKKLRIVSWRDNRATGQLRRYRGISKNLLNRKDTKALLKEKNTQSETDYVKNK